MLPKITNIYTTLQRRYNWIFANDIFPQNLLSFDMLLLRGPVDNSVFTVLELLLCLFCLRADSGNPFPMLPTYLAILVSRFGNQLCI